MKVFTQIFFLLFLGLLSFQASAQTAGAEAETRFLLNNVDCNTDEVFIYVEIRAAVNSPQFFLRNVNFRWSYTPRTTIAPMPILHGSSPDNNPESAPIWISDFITYNNIGTPTAAGGTWFECGQIAPIDPHNLIGSNDTIVSYNFTAAGGGVCLIPGEWRTIGEIRVDILDGSECFDFIWHAPTVLFPPTVVKEVLAGEVYDVPIGNQENTSFCYDAVCNPLPIELNSFTGADKGCENLIEWSTVSETENSHFVLESSSDGINYRTIATIDGAGTTLEAQNYSFVDKDMDNTTYYSLTQVDFDGTSEKVGTITVVSACFNNEEVNSISELYPNPSFNNSSINIKFLTNQIAGEGKLIITDILGRVVDVAPLEIINGANIFEYNTQKIGSGTYFARIQGTDWFSKSMKFVKIN